MNPRIIFLILGTIGLLLGWLLLSDGGIANPTLAVAGRMPLIIGGYGDNFQYSGDDVRGVKGSLLFRLDEDAQKGLIRAQVETTEASGSVRLSADVELEGKIDITAAINQRDKLYKEISIHGDTGIGGPELPLTYAQVFGWGVFLVSIGGEAVTELPGEWGLIRALRKEDGAIRQSGLTYSPLLRDKSGFSDRERSEFFLLLHSQDEDTENNPQYTAALHIVFAEVEIETDEADGLAF